MYGVSENMIKKNMRSILSLIAYWWISFKHFLGFADDNDHLYINKKNYPKLFQTVCDIEEVVYFDFETTGLNPYHDEIIEYSFLVDDGEDDETNINSLVNPEMKFEKKITDITGIHPEELENQDTIDKHLARIYHFVDGEHTKQILGKKFPDIYLVAHNCHGFDEIFLRRNFGVSNKFNISNWKFIDSLMLARKLLPNLRSYSLDSLCNHFGTDKGSHRALDDTKALKQVFHKLVEIMAKEKRITKQYLLDHPQLILDSYKLY